MCIAWSRNQTLNRVMALFYTQGDFTAAGNASTRIVGTVAANRFCFARGCGGGGTPEAKLFEVTLKRFVGEQCGDGG